MTAPSGGGTSEVRYKILGPVEVRLGNDGVNIGGPRERRSLAGLLLQANQVVSIDRIMEILWGEKPPRTAPTQVRNTITTLRRQLATADGGQAPIARVGAGYMIRVGEGQLDSAVFSQYVASARLLAEKGDLRSATVALRSALRLWLGPALGGLDGPVLSGYAQRLEEQRLACLEWRIELDLELGFHQDLAGELFTLVQEHPLRERLVELTMLCLYRAGRRQDALQAYAGARQRLADQIGLDPRPQLARLHQAILHCDPSLDQPGGAERPLNGHIMTAGEGVASRPHVLVPRQLPRAVTQLVGRESELATILTALEPRDATGSTLIAVDGPGGVGKSTLAVAAGHRAARMFPDGQLYVDLQGATAALTPLAVADVIGRFLRALGVTTALPATEAEAVSLYRTLIAQRRVLIIADNARSAEQLDALLPATPGSALIATSRRVLGMLDGALHIALRPLAKEDAHTLLAHVAGRGWVEDESHAIATVAQACGYLPLALRIAGARLVSHPHWTVAYLADRLADERRVLHELNAEDETLRVSLQLSWRELLAEDDPIPVLAARVFIALGTVRLPTFSLGLVAALAGAAPEPIELALDRLVEVRLVERDHGRFQMHDLVRQFAAELAAGDPARQERLRTALTWYASAADQVGRLMRGTIRATDRPQTDPLSEVTDATAAGAWLDGERANLVALARQALLDSRTVSRLAAELVLALYPAILMRGHAYEWEVLCRLVVDAADRVEDTRLVANTLTRLSVTLAIQRRVDEALECLERGLKLHRLSGDRSGEASALETAGMVHARVGRAEEALPYFEHSLRLREELGDRYAEGITLSNAAEAYHRLGRGQEALGYLERSLQIRREFGDLAGEAITLLNMGEVLAKLGMNSDALRMAHGAIESARKAGDRESERRSLDLRARIQITAGDIDAALMDCEAVLRLAVSPENAGDLSELISTLESVGQHEIAGRMRRRAVRAGSSG